MQQPQAICIAGIGCFLVLIIIAVFVFTMQTNQLIDYLTIIGQFVGGGTKLGVFILAALPPIAGFCLYWIAKWAEK